MTYCRRTSPFDLWSLAVQTSWMMAEAQAVIWMRLMGMAGLWSVASSEQPRMFTEKVDAYMRAVAAAQRAAFDGASATRTAAVALKPYSSRTAGNVRRLSRCGPKRK
ncbi:antibiotic ABC transporter [Qingshengfaniella alkalisoli]|uniref:Antibiotic ABC transporter n=1 Tax=Qingshengfaniella alkalisoli TaxID=2599296 RepID=A0A5B8J396_9RHOB|nr:antibiotic ABC transporter [Qingshengfaniella alkalisoli]QDY68967.1 antibiotic ABC transporter [Qingshengfaniella alkalisoli]